MDWDLNHYSALADSFQSEKRCVEDVGGMCGVGAAREWWLPRKTVMRASRA